MKKTERKSLEKKLLTEIRKVIKVNKVALPNKTEKVIKKVFKKLVKKTNKAKATPSKK